MNLDYKIVPGLFISKQTLTNQYLHYVQLQNIFVLLYFAVAKQARFK